MSDTCGPTSGRRFADYDPASRSWRMWPDIGLWGSIEFSATWPRTGYMRDGSAFELPTSAHPTDASDSSLSPTLPTPTSRDHKGRNQRNDETCLPGGDRGAGLNLLPTPAVNDMGAGKTVEAWDEWTDAMRAKHGNGNGHGKSLAIEAQRLLPTPTSSDSKASGGGYNGQSNVTLTDATVRNRGLQWGDYIAGIVRWRTTLGRAAPAPTEAGRLSPLFVEWMMGLPPGHVTDVGLTSAQSLKVLGNGVVPQQGAHALRLLLGGAW